MKRFFFPEYGVTVEAATLDDATKAVTAQKDAPATDEKPRKKRS